MVFKPVFAVPLLEDLHAMLHDLVLVALLLEDLREVLFGTLIEVFAPECIVLCTKRDLICDDASSRAQRPSLPMHGDADVAAVTAFIIPTCIAMVIRKGML